MFSQEILGLKDTGVKDTGKEKEKEILAYDPALY